jgi:hypothetical protein
MKCVPHQLVHPRWGSSRPVVSLCWPGARWEPPEGTPRCPLPPTRPVTWQSASAHHHADRARCRKKRDQPPTSTAAVQSMESCPVSQIAAITVLRVTSAPPRDDLLSPSTITYSVKENGEERASENTQWSPESIQWPALWWGTLCDWAYGIRRARYMVPPHGCHTQTRQLPAPYCQPLPTQQILHPYIPQGVE